MLSNILLLTQVVGFGVFLWLACYLVAKVAKPTMLVVVSAIGLLSLAAFFASSVLSYTAPDPTTFASLDRWWWWTAVVPVVVWHHFTVLVARRLNHRPSRIAELFGRWSLVLAYSFGAIFVALGSVTDLVVDRRRIFTGMLWVGPQAGRLYSLYAVFLSVVALAALLNLGWSLRGRMGRRVRGGDGEQGQLKLLFLSSLSFLVGAIWLASLYMWSSPAAALPGYLCLLAGLAGIGSGVARWGMLLEGQDIRRDIGYHFTLIMVLNVLYVGLLLRLGLRSGSELLVLVGLVTMTHTAFDRGRALLDRLFFTRAERAARAEARDYAEVLATEPVLPPSREVEATVANASMPSVVAEAPRVEAWDEKRFKDLVRKAITGLKSPPQLARSPLLALNMVEQRIAASEQEANRLNRAAALRELLVEQIESLRPVPTDTAKVGDAWRFYNVLYYPYVQGLSRKGALVEARRLAMVRQRSGRREPDELEQVLVWLADIDEDTFYKWQRRASDIIALTLWEARLKPRPEQATTESVTAWQHQ